MLVRKSILAALVAAAGGLAVTSAVRADQVEERQPLHAVGGSVDLRRPGTVHGPVEVIVPDAIVLDRARVLQRLDRAMAEVDELAMLVREVPVAPPRGVLGVREQPHGAFADYHGRRGPVVDADAIRARAEELRGELLALRRMAERAPAAPVVTPVEEPIAQRDLALFLRSLGEARFSNDKLELVRDLARHVNVTSEQAARIVRALPSWVQLDAALLLFEVTLDPAAFGQVESTLLYASDRARLHDLLTRRFR